MKVVILCGGRGTRLREETEFGPKPLMDVDGHPILWHIMKLYAHHGICVPGLSRQRDYRTHEDCFERLTAKRHLIAYNHEGFFYAMDTYRDYQLLNDLWKNGQAPRKIWQ